LNEAFPAMTAPAEAAPDTAARILDAAELLFIERGFAATSLRAIATSAGVNLAATHYHFGSKQGLLAAVFHRRAAPINERRLAGLDRLLASDQALTTRNILEVFLQPFVQDDTYTTAPAVVGWIYGEPESLSKPIFEQEFTEVATRFQQALATVLPKLDKDELRWRFHFMVGSMIHLLKSNTPLGVPACRGSFPQGLAYLIDFAVAGLEQHTTGTRND
jgi:AcrR family transcriptional regulator